MNDVKRREKNAKDRNIKWKTRQTAKEQKSTVHTYVSNRWRETFDTGKLVFPSIGRREGGHAIAVVDVP